MKASTHQGKADIKTLQTRCKDFEDAIDSIDEDLMKILKELKLQHEINEQTAAQISMIDQWIKAAQSTQGTHTETY